jgi:hypothetical protein
MESGAWLCLAIGIFFGGAALILFGYTVYQGMALERARQKYQRWLEDFRDRPDDRELHDQVLWFGRQFIDMARRCQSIGKSPIFDEFMLLNDINAARAGRGGLPATLSVEERLEQLGRLRDRGYIDAKEYAEHRRRILDGL